MWKQGKKWIMINGFCKWERNGRIKGEQVKIESEMNWTAMIELWGAKNWGQPLFHYFGLFLSEITKM